MTEQTPKNTLPDLEDRFLPPAEWRWHIFKNAKGRTLRFGSVFPENKVPEAVVIGLQGLGEFNEKYFELAHDLVKRGIAFWMMDWQGQGKSERHLKTRINATRQVLTKTCPTFTILLWSMSSIRPYILMLAGSRLS